MQALLDQVIGASKQIFQLQSVAISQQQLIPKALLATFGTTVWSDSGFNKVPRTVFVYTLSSSHER